MLFLGLPEKIILFVLPFFLFGIIRSSKRLHLDRTDRILPSLKGAVLVGAIPITTFGLDYAFSREFTTEHLKRIFECSLCLFLYCGFPYVLGNLIRRQRQTRKDVLQNVQPRGPVNSSTPE